MRAILTIVLGIAAVLDQIHPYEGIGIEAGDGIGAEVGEINLELVAFRVQPAPLDAGGEDLVIAGLHQLAAIPVVNEHVVGLDAGRLELLDHFEDDLERRMGMGLTVGNDLDPYDVAWLEEMLPAFYRVLGAGQFLDSAVHRGLYRGGVSVAVLDHRRILDLDDMARVRPGGTGLALAGSRCSLMPDGAEHLRAGSGQSRNRGDQRNRGGRGAQEMSAAQAATGISMLHGGWTFRRDFASEDAPRLAELVNQ